MKKKTRVLCLCSLGLFFLFGYVNYITYHPPRDSSAYHSVSPHTLLAHSNDFEAQKVIVRGEIDSINPTSHIVTFTSANGKIRFNYSLVSPSEFHTGDKVVFKGVSYITTKGYVLVHAYHRFGPPYSLYLSLLAVFIILLPLILKTIDFDTKQFGFTQRDENA